MKELDFTPEWYVKALADREGTGLRLGGFIILGVLLIVAGLESGRQTRAATQKLQEVQGAYDVQSPMLKRLEELKNEQAHWMNNAKVLADVSGGFVVADIFTELSHLMPRSLTLREVYLHKSPRVIFAGKAADEKDDELTEEAEATVFEVAGWAASGSEIGTFVRRMSESPLFYDVSLRYERPETIYGKSVVEFRVVSRMAQFE